MTKGQVVEADDTKGKKCMPFALSGKRWKRQKKALKKCLHRQLGQSRKADKGMLKMFLQWFG